MSSRSVVIKVDATAGLAVEEGEDVNAGQVLGQKIEMGEAEFAPVAGVIRQIRFCPDEHCFKITIETKKH